MLDPFQRPVVVQARDIYLEFIADTAEQQVNLPATVKVALDTWYDELIQRSNSATDSIQIITLLRNAQIEIYQLMRGDSLHRFQATEDFQKLEKRWAQKELLDSKLNAVDSREGSKGSKGSKGVGNSFVFNNTNNNPNHNNNNTTSEVMNNTNEISPSVHALERSPSLPSQNSIVQLSPSVPASPSIHGERGTSPEVSPSPSIHHHRDDSAVLTNLESMNSEQLHFILPPSILHDNYHDDDDHQEQEPEQQQDQPQDQPQE